MFGYSFVVLALLVIEGYGWIAIRTNHRTTIENRLKHTALCNGKRPMEIWWDGRNETKVPPTILFEEFGTSADRWILDDDERIPNGNHSILRVVDGTQLKAPKDPSVVGTIVLLDDDDDDDASGQEEALAAMGSVEWILVETAKWQMIPAENLIAAARSTGTKLSFGVSKASDVAGLSGALELGVDALCISSSDPTLWETAVRARKDRNALAAKAEPSFASIPEITTGSCWRRDTKGTVLADRICVDFVQTLSSDEGCWVGSSAKLMALVLSEAASSRYVPTRPFRVNAGPVHSYILMGDSTTKYLCELQPSDQVLVYNTHTNSSRAVAVGRLKEEVRPCVLVELEAGPRSRGQVFLQQAETVRLGRPSSGNFVRVTDLEAQSGSSDNTNHNTEPVLLRVMNTGTHVGKVYTGKVEER